LQTLVHAGTSYRWAGSMWFRSSHHSLSASGTNHTVPMRNCLSTSRSPRAAAASRVDRGYSVLRCLLRWSITTLPQTSGFTSLSTLAVHVATAAFTLTLAAGWGGRRSVDRSVTVCQVVRNTILRVYCYLGLGTILLRWSWEARTEGIKVHPRCTGPTKHLKSNADLPRDLPPAPRRVGKSRPGLVDVDVAVFRIYSV
jgi:hypothetical protein